MKKLYTLGFTLFLAAALAAQPMYRKFIAPNFTTAARPTCPTAGPTGYIYWDTTTTKLQVCDGSAYADLGVALSGANTWTGLNTFGRTAAGNDACFGATNTICIDGDSGFIIGSVAASVLELRISTTNVFDVLPIPAAGSGASLLSASSTLNAMNGSDTIVLLDVTTVNANHTGVGNVLDGVRVANITGDADATENAIFIGTGWDNDILLGSGASLVSVSANETALAVPNGANLFYLREGATDAQIIFRVDNTSGVQKLVIGGDDDGWGGASLGGFLGFDLSSLQAMDGNDTNTVIDIAAFTDANHTSTGNVLNAINIGAITSPDAQATHNAINIGAGWDTAISADTLKLNGDSATQLTSGGGATIAMLLQPGQEFQFRSTTTALAVVGAAQNVDPVSNIQHIGAGAAADVATVSRPTNGQASNQATWITFICDDANLTFTNANVGAAQTLDLAGNFVCSVADTLTIAYDVTNDRWVEVARSVN